MTKQRLDQLLVERELAESREKAQRLIRSGSVSVNGQVKEKPGHTFPDDARIELKEAEKFVSRGGHKLEGAFEAFALQVEGRTCVDVGSSTGGFTDCLLQRGATQVYAVDVGKGQLHWKLRQDPRVVILEGINARHLDPEWFQPQPTFGVVDVSFISLKKILPALDKVLARPAEVVTLIKPQFEAGREKVGKGGVVRDDETRKEVVWAVRVFGEHELGWQWLGYVPSPLKGPAGNVEFLAYWKTRDDGLESG